MPSRPRLRARIVIYSPNRPATTPARSPSLAPHATGNFSTQSARTPVCFGREDGSFEAWIYPLKLFRDFQLKFRVGDIVLDGDAIPRTITVRPESVSVKYIYDSFTACATWFVPIDERAAIVEIEVNSFDPGRRRGLVRPRRRLDVARLHRRRLQSMGCATEGLSLQQRPSCLLGHRRLRGRQPAHHHLQRQLLRRTHRRLFLRPARQRPRRLSLRDDRVVREPEGRRRSLPQAAHRRQFNHFSKLATITRTISTARCNSRCPTATCSSPTTGRASAPCKDWSTNRSPAKAWSPDTTSPAAAIAPASVGTSAATPCGPRSRSTPSATSRPPAPRSSS